MRTGDLECGPHCVLCVGLVDAIENSLASYWRRSTHIRPHVAGARRSASMAPSGFPVTERAWGCHCAGMLRPIL